MSTTSVEVNDLESRYSWTIAKIVKGYHMFYEHRLGRQAFVLQYEPQRCRLCRAFRRALIRKLGTELPNLV